MPIKGGLVRSPLREDLKPTCSFYYGKTGRLYFHDFGIDKSFDVFAIVMELYNISFREAITRIIADMDRLNTEVEQLFKRNEGTYTALAATANWNYFDRYYISKDTLSKFNVYPVSLLFINNYLAAQATTDDPMFAYKFSSGRLKIYRPLSLNHRDKWSGNSNAEDISGFDQLPYRGKLLIITSSMKDVMVLHEQGYNAIAFNGEGYGTSNSTSSQFIESIIRQLQRRFEYVIFFMDNDAPGRKYSEKLSFKYGCPFMLLPEGPKDISDYICKYGVRKTKKIMKKILSKQLRNAKSNIILPVIDVPY